MSYSGHSREKNQSLGSDERTPGVESDGAVEGEPTGTKKVSRKR
jgi:hypothetical protein